MKTIKKLLSSIAILVTLFVPIQAIASTLPIAPAIFETSLSFPESTTDTSLTLVSTGLNGGQTLPAGYSCFTIDQGQPNTEYECGTVVGTTVSNLVRGIDPLTGNTSDSNLIFSHRRGADVKITDFPVLTLIRNILNGNDTLPGPISYAPGINPIGNQDLATKAYVNSVVTGGTVTTNQVTVSGIAGANVTVGNLIYLKVTDGKWYPTTATDPTTLNNVQIGIAQSTTTIGSSITSGVLISGVDTHNTGTAGFYAYASNTTGAISGVAGTNVKVVGEYVPSSAGLYFDPGFFTTITVNQEAALAGNGGTPSASNTYVTQQGLVSGSNPVVVVETTTTTWTKPTGLKYAVVEVIGGGGNGSGGSSVNNGAGGGGGGYSKLTISASSLLTNETVTIGATTSFGAHNSSTAGSNASGTLAGSGGLGSGGDINLNGGDGFSGVQISGGAFPGANGGASFYGNSVKGGVINGNGNNGRSYGSGGSGGGTNASSTAGGSGASGVVILTEYFQ